MYSLYYQQSALEYVEEHFEAEKAAGREINPAIPASQREEPGCKASSICSSVSQSAGILAW